MTIETKKPVLFVNNKDLLAEIHKSKTSYCSFINPLEDHEYDLIVEIPESTLFQSFDFALLEENIEKAKKTRSIRKNTNLSEISDDELVFRIMTWDHIPLSKKQPRKIVKRKTAKEIIEFDVDETEDDFAELEDSSKTVVDDMVHVKVNFPPFQHFRLDKMGTMQCIGKSHWKGDLKDGEFCKDHGQITNKLAKMYIMMCEKYALKYNWRGYSYVDEFKNSAILQLTYVGLRFNEARSSQAFSYITQTIHNAFLRVLGTEKKSHNIRDDLLEMNNLNPSYSRQSSGSSKFEE